MKTQHETTIQFSGYPLSIVREKNKRAELIVVKSPLLPKKPSIKNSIADDPKNWGIDWFSDYE